MAAVAVVLVQSVVGGTAQDVASHSARQEAAQLATFELSRRWQAEVPDSPEDADRLNREYSQRCRRLGILYGDIDLAPRPFEGFYDLGPGWRPGRAWAPSCNLR